MLAVVSHSPNLVAVELGGDSAYRGAGHWQADLGGEGGHRSVRRHARLRQWHRSQHHRSILVPLLFHSSVICV